MQTRTRRRQEAILAPSEEGTAMMQDRIREIHNALDLGFSDYFRDQNVREATILQNLDDIAEAVEVLRAEEGVNFSLFQAFGGQHPSAQTYILDFPSDLRASFYLVLGGYYRPAIASLRNWLEMRLLGIYFGFVDRSKYEAWKKGKLDKQESPFGTKLIGWIFRRAEFQKAEKGVRLRSSLECLYHELSELAHGAGLEKYNLQADTDNVPRYNTASVDLWLKLMYRTLAEIVFCLFIAYGKDTFRGLSSDEIRTILRHMPETYKNEFEAVLGVSR
jgi:hypothetical protein